MTRLKTMPPFRQTSSLLGGFQFNERAVFVVIGQGFLHGLERQAKIVTRLLCRKAIGPHGGNQLTDGRVASLDGELSPPWVRSLNQITPARFRILGGDAFLEALNPTESVVEALLKKFDFRWHGVYLT